MSQTYHSLEEAFWSLPEETRNHSLRVGDYTRILFNEAIAIEFRPGDRAAEAVLQEDNEEAAYLCGLYHDIGKVTLPPAYHTAIDDGRGPEEVALYKRHVSDGAELVDQCLAESELTDPQRKMLKEVIECHHQYVMSGGFPTSKTEEEMAVMPLLVGFADRLDHIITARKSETPFEDVFTELQRTDSDEGDETELTILARECQSQLKKVFLKYRDQSQEIPATPVFVKRRSLRPFALKYRPVAEWESNRVTGARAKIFFKDYKDSYIEYEEVADLVLEHRMLPDIGRYFIYEAGDTWKRAKTCGLSIEYVALELPAALYGEPEFAEAVLSQLADTGMEPGCVVPVMEESLFAQPTEGLLANLKALKAAGIPVLVNGWKGEHITPDQTEAYPVEMVELHPELYERLMEETTVSLIEGMKEKGISLMAGGLPKGRTFGHLRALGISLTSGPLSGEYRTEDELIRAELSGKKI